MTSEVARPRGADEVRVALTDAAARLLGQRSPGRISGRDLAGEAGVNYGLIHYYFGSKDEGLRAASPSERPTRRVASGAIIVERTGYLLAP